MDNHENTNRSDGIDRRGMLRCMAWVVNRFCMDDVRRADLLASLRAGRRLDRAGRFLVRTDQ